MDLHPDMSVGDRLKVARRAAGLTQEQLAERAAVNVDTIRKLEQNTRHSMRVSTANSLANVIGIETSTLLLGERQEQEDAQEAADLRRLREVLAPSFDFAPAVDIPGADAPPDLPALRDAVGDAWSQYHAGQFAALLTTLPQLITEARVASRENSSDSAAPAHAVLAKALQLGAHTAVQNRMEDLALLGLDRAGSAAQQSDHPLLPAMTMNSVAWIFLRTGRLADSEQIAVAAADQIEPGFRRSPADQVAVYGGLLLSAATAAARDSRADTGRELIRVAGAAAQRVGEDSTDRMVSVFGPTSVAMQAVSLETTAGEWDQALSVARRVPMTGRVPVSWKARFLLDVAHAQAETYRDADAVETLRSARTLAPAWTRRAGLAKAITRDLMARRHRPRGVTALADFLGVAH
jgi:transcriptional regulator with XRE-family HTH domain